MGRGWTAGHPRAAWVHGRVAPAAGGLLRLVWPEALPAGGIAAALRPMSGQWSSACASHKVRRVSVLLGGLITLAVTALVQILIIPWVQTRTRRRDRWEKDVIELET